MQGLMHKKSPTSKSVPQIVALGRRLAPLERVATVGEILGLGSRATAYRMAQADGWPLVGPRSSRWVLVLQLLARYQIPYSIEAENAGAAADGKGPGVGNDSTDCAGQIEHTTLAEPVLLPADCQSEGSEDQPR